MRGQNSSKMWLSATALWIGATGLWLGGSSAKADCNVEKRQAAGNYFRVIKCDESQQAIDEAIVREAESCTDSTQNPESPCYDEIVESHRLRKEAMLRRALKDGASIEAAAQLYGYTVEEVEWWIAENTPPNNRHSKPADVPAVVIQAEQDLDRVRAMAERQAASR